MSDWQPTASLERLRLRAGLLAATREFFAVRRVLEVETPILVNRGVTDVNLHSVTTELGSKRMYLHTSPEYAMKRLLAAGSGDIFQLCHVARGDERSPLHNPEFTLLEWYRCGVSMAALIEEVAALLDSLMNRAGRSSRTLRTLTYQQAFIDAVGIDPLDADIERIMAIAVARGLDAKSAAALDRDGLLDFLVGAIIGPALGHGEWVALTHYPASQAALAKLSPTDPRTALRFEIYADGIELANGFEELASATEQRTRFEADNKSRHDRGLPQMPLDERLLSALDAGLPACSGVALGFDRAAMIAAAARRIDEVITFPAGSA